MDFLNQLRASIRKSAGWYEQARENLNKLDEEQILLDWAAAVGMFRKDYKELFTRHCDSTKDEIIDELLVSVEEGNIDTDMLEDLVEKSLQVVKTFG